MNEKKTDNDPPAAGPLRSQNLVRVLPRDWTSLAEVITPSMERIDSTLAQTQLIVVTPDPTSTFAVVRGSFERFGTVGIDLFPATSEHRAARMMAGVPVPAIAGPPTVLRALVARSVLRVDGVRSVLFAWIGDLIESGGEQLEALEAVLGELPEDAARTLVVRDVTPAVQSFIDRYMFRARRVPATEDPDAERPAPRAIEYVTTPSAARPASLWRLLDELDPPSAIIVARHPDSEADARRTLAQLGYRRADDAVRVAGPSDGADAKGVAADNVHTVILYDPPLSPTDMDVARSATAARVVAFVEPRDIALLRDLTGGLARPLTTGDNIRQARRKEDTLRGEIKQILDAGVAFRELTALEPLLEQYDSVEIAAALLRLLERERERLTPAPPVGGDRPPRPRDDRPPPPRGRGDRPDRGAPPRGPARHGRDASRGGPPRGRGGDRGGSRR